VKFASVPGLKGFGWLVLFAVQLVGAFAASAEDRTLSMYNIHTKETITVTFKKNGKYVPEALQQLNHFMRDWRRNMEIKMDPALIDLIWELHEELGSKVPVNLICGYRSAATNENLRHTVGGQARHSRHITGQAADLNFPDVPLKQLRYSALIEERGGVGFYPASGIPFVHVDTGNVRHWPRVPRLELALLFPSGHSKHIPADGRPLTPADARLALAKYQASGAEMPWVFTHKKAGPIIASLMPSDARPIVNIQPVSLTSAPSAVTKDDGNDLKNLPPDLAAAEAAEPQLSEEGDEQDDDIAFEPLPATFLLAEKPLSYSDVPDSQTRPPVFRKLGLLMAPPNVLTGEEFDKRLQIEALYEANQFKGPAITFMAWHNRARIAAAEGTSAPQTAR
jgi:uncharacterized protein YcbK (DUF882 family)